MHTMLSALNFVNTRNYKFLVRRFLWPALNDPQSEKMRSTYAWEAGAATKSSANLTGSEYDAGSMLQNVTVSLSSGIC